MVKIKQQLISNTKNKSGTKNTKRIITLHMTGNTGRGANAQAHANLQSNGNSRSANWHWQVDDKIAIQSFLHKFQLWHSGDGGYGSGTLESIAIEGCVNSDGNYNNMINNMIDLCVYIMKEENIDSINMVVTHWWWSGKNCPTQMFAGKNGWTYDAFIGEIENRLGKEVTVKREETKNKPSKKENIGVIATQVINGVWGNGADRKRRLENAGYNFNSVQKRVNQILTNGSKTKVQSLSNKQGLDIETMAREIIDGKHGNGVANRRKSLGISQATMTKVQDRVNEIMGVKKVSKKRKSNQQIANEVNKGLWGNGADRKSRITKAGYNYNTIQGIVNRMYK